MAGCGAGGRATAGTGRALGRVLAVLAFVVSGCGGPVEVGRSPEAGDREVARVAGRPLYASDVRRAAVADGALTEGETLDVAAPLFHRTLDELIDEKLLAREGERLGVARVPSVRRRLQAARDKIVGDALVEQRVDRAVTDRAVRALYDEQRRLAGGGEEMHARRILCPDQACADGVRKLLATGADFAALALQKSEDATTRFNGGDLGWFDPDTMPEAYGQTLRSARVGEVVGPIRVDGGFAVLRVDERRPEKPVGLDEARPQIVRFLTYDEIRTLLARLRKQTRVDVLVPGASPSAEPASAPKPTAASSPQ